MNTESSIPHQEKLSNLAPSTDVNERKIWDMEQDMELLQEQVKSLKQELAQGYEFTNECLQELAYAKQELESMNEEISNLINSKKLPMDEAKPLASRIVKSKRAINEPLTEPVEAIDYSPAELKELERIENSSMSSPIDTFKAEIRNLKAQSHQMIEHSLQLKNKSQQITVESYTIHARSSDLKEHSREVRTRLRKERVSGEPLEGKIGSRLPFRAIANKRCSS